MVVYGVHLQQGQVWCVLLNATSLADVIWRKTVDTRREGGVDGIPKRGVFGFVRCFFFLGLLYCTGKTQFVFVTVALPYKLLRYLALKVHPGRDHCALVA
jgi:hypothetical protein